MEFDYRLALMTGVDIPIPECQLTVRQPKLYEISMIGERTFSVGAQLLCIDKEDFRQELPVDNNFNLLMMVLKEEEAKDKKYDLKIVLQLLLPDYQVILTPRSILCKKGEENLIIDEGNFESFQKIAKKICGLSKKQTEDGEIHEVYNPANERARRIAEKIQKGRAELAKRRVEANPDDSMFSRYISVLTIGLNSMSVEDLKNLTVFQINDLFERFTLKVQSDIDLKIRLAGGTSDNQAENWMKPLH